MYQLIFRPDGRICGYTEDEDEIKAFMKHRKKDEFLIRPFPKKDIPKHIRALLKKKLMRIEPLHDVYLLPEEYDVVLEELSRTVSEMYSAFDGVDYISHFLKLSDREREIIDKWEAMGAALINIIDLTISTGETELYGECLKMEQMVLDILKDVQRRQKHVPTIP